MRGEENKNETIRKKMKQALRGDLELGKKNCEGQRTSGCKEKEHGTQMIVGAEVSSGG